jgi:hypothetical protein
VVRKRGQQIKIGAGFYVNVSDLVARNHQLSDLLADLRASTMSNPWVSATSCPRW